MGNTLQCCRLPKEELLNLDSLACIDPSLLQQIIQIRADNQQQIDASREYRSKLGPVFRGKMVNEKRTGYGQLYSQDWIFLGEWKNNLPNGYGILVENQQKYYRGYFKAGKFHGSGRQFSVDYQFQGEFEQGQKKKGTFMTQEYKYKGSFKDEKFDGEGRLSYHQGITYEGEFKQGIYEGKGLLVFQNGNTYQGGFQAGKYSGEGKYSYPDGTIVLGTYKNGRRVRGKKIACIQVPSISDPSTNEKRSVNSRWDTVATPKRWFEGSVEKSKIRGSGVLEL